ncbi:hypothetical protein JAO84_27910 [Streptomyces fradiae]
MDRGLPVPVAAAFRSFDWQPVAVGCVAQVHRAVLDCDTDVAVKVVKSGVRQQLEAGTRALKVLLVVAHALCPPRCVDTTYPVTLPSCGPSWRASATCVRKPPGRRRWHGTSVTIRSCIFPAFSTSCARATSWSWNTSTASPG